MQGRCVALEEVDPCTVPIPQMGAILEDKGLNPGESQGTLAVAQCLWQLKTLNYVLQQLGSKLVLLFNAALSNEM